MDQVPCDSHCLADRRLSGFDNRIRNIRLALGCANGLTRRLAAIYSTSKPNTGTIPDAHSHRSAGNESNTDSYTDTDAVTKSSAYQGAPTDSSTSPPIASLIGFERLNARVTPPPTVPETPSAFHLHAQRNAFHHRDVRQRRKSFPR
jgi:hypothetical protein